MMIDKLNDFLHLSYFENEVWHYLLFAGIILAGFIFKKLLARALGFIIYRLFRKQAQGLSVKQFYQLTRKPLGFLLLLVFIYIGCEQIRFPESWDLAPVDEFGLRMVLLYVFEITVLSTLIWLGMRIIDFLGLIFLARAAGDQSRMNDHLIPFAVDILKIIVIVLGIFIILGSVFDLNIGSLIAGLGIGGLAVALAAKETLENLFGSFTIFLDKPFTVGDWIRVGETEGIVEKVGFRSTRIRTFERSFVTIPNKKMIDAELDNMTMRTSMRARFNLGLRYDTSADTLKKIMKEVGQAISDQEKTDEYFVVRMAEFGPSSLNILVLYYVLTDDWDEFMKIREALNFRFMEIIQANGASFAFPSTSVYFEKNQDPRES